MAIERARLNGDRRKQEHGDGRCGATRQSDAGADAGRAPENQGYFVANAKRVARNERIERERRGGQERQWHDQRRRVGFIGDKELRSNSLNRKNS